MKIQMEHPDFALIRDRWEKCLSDGTFETWFDIAKPRPSWHWKWIAILSFSVCLIPVAVAILISRVIRISKRSRFKNSYRSNPEDRQILLAYGFGYVSDFTLGFFDDHLGIKRMFVPADRRIGEFGWDSEIVKLIDTFQFNRSFRERNKSLIETLASRTPFPAPFQLPLEATNGREIWAADVPNLSVHSLLKDPEAKPLVVPCLWPIRPFSNPVPLPQFLINDFREIDQEYRKVFSSNKSVIEQILDSEEPKEAIQKYFEYLSYERRNTFTKEEELIFEVFEVERYIRSEGLDAAIPAYGSERVTTWLEGLKRLGMGPQHEEAKKVIPYLHQLSERFGDYSEWEYDDVMGEVSESFPTSIRYQETEAFDVKELLLKFARENLGSLR